MSKPQRTWGVTRFPAIDEYRSGPFAFRSIKFLFQVFRRSGTTPRGNRWSAIRIDRRLHANIIEPAPASARSTEPITGLPTWIAPQLSQLAETVPEGDRWAHEIKLDGYRMHAHLDRGQVKLPTSPGLDWTEKYPSTVKALRAIASVLILRRISTRAVAYLCLCPHHRAHRYGTGMTVGKPLAVVPRSGGWLTC